MSNCCQRLEELEVEVELDAAETMRIFREVLSLRAELARRDEQIAAVRALIADTYAKQRQARYWNLIQDIRAALAGGAS